MTICCLTKVSAEMVCSWASKSVFQDVFAPQEQECFQEELRRAQRKLLKISRDKSFLLDRLLQYERVEGSSSDSGSTASSDSEKESKKVT